MAVVETIAQPKRPLVVKGVIFDMDGVLVDSEPLHRKVEREMFEGFNAYVSEKEHCALSGVSDQHLWTLLKRRYGISVPVIDLVKMKRHKYLTQLKRQGSVQLVSSAMELLERLRRQDFRLALASSSPREQIEWVLREFGLARFFCAVVSGDDVPQSKPAPDIFLAALRALNLNASECVVIEDSSNGILSAHRAGITAIGYGRGADTVKGLSVAECYIDKLEDVSVSLLEKVVVMAVNPESYKYGA